MRFDATAVVGEQRKTVAEVCPDIDFALPVPDPEPELSWSLRPARPRRTGRRVHRRRASTTPRRSVIGCCAIRSPPACCGSLPTVLAHGPTPSPASPSRFPSGVRRSRATPEAVAAALERFVALVSQARGRTRKGDAAPAVLRRGPGLDPRGHPPQAIRDRAAPVPVGGLAGRPTTTTQRIELPSVYCTVVRPVGVAGGRQPGRRPGSRRDRAARVRP